MADYLAEPTDTDGPRPGIVVIHEAYGLDDDIRAKADRLASRGYLALAVDLFDHGPRAKCVLGAFRSVATGKGRAYDEIDAARRRLAERPDCTGKVGVIGFCMGGGFALQCAPKLDFAAAAPNYGVVPRNASEVLRGSCPIVASYGGSDPMLPGAGKKLEKALTEADVEHDVKVYPGASHSFLNQHTSGISGVMARVSGMNYHGPSAVDAWRRIDAFFDEHLGAAS
jgi:carboxymethylenebutenolidase